MLDLADKQAGDKDAFMYFEKKEVKSATYHEFVLTTEYLGVDTSPDEKYFEETPN